eukprot:m.185607 g.185607  ORF g.185607 m.185607 type:complete len:675 (-) comp15577_c0_seq5:2171-4195(-)
MEANISSLDVSVTSNFCTGDDSGQNMSRNGSPTQQKQKPRQASVDSFLDISTRTQAPGLVHLYEDISIGTNEASFVLRGGPDRGPYNTIAIELLNDSVRVRAPDATELNSLKQIAVVLGILNLISGPYLVIANRRLLVGQIYGHDVFQAKDIELLGFRKTYRHLSEVQVECEKKYLKGLKTYLNQDGFYYSYSFDLTHRIQSMHVVGPEFYSRSMLERADERFVWNKFLLEPLTSIPELAGYHLPLIFGYIGMATVTVNKNRSLEMAVVSRRCTKNAGTRFNTRGINGRGYVANYIETELIVKMDNFYFSYTQTRGSVPVFWEQKPNLRYKPRINIKDGNHLAACSLHLHSEIRRNGKQSVVNLISHKGHEGLLYTCFTECMSALCDANIRYIPFDFNKECGRLDWTNLLHLMNQLEPDILSQGSFISEAHGDTVKLHIFQQGVFRTNCVDSLDRSNLVQAMIAQRALELQLQWTGVLQTHESLNALKEFQHFYKNMWADNGDTLANQYGGSHILLHFPQIKQAIYCLAGSKAMKSDFTRTGRRTVGGLFQDAAKALLRYYRNNFEDGSRQDAVNVLLGKYKVRAGEGVTFPSPLATSQTPRSSLGMLLAVLLMLSGLVANLFIPSSIELSINSWLNKNFWLTWIISLAALAGIINMRGEHFVDKPRLNLNEEK